MSTIRGERSARDRFGYLLVLYVFYLLFFVWRTSFTIDGTRYFSLFDDMMVSMRYAANLAAGYGLAWNPTQAPIEGFTNLAWVLFMSLIHLLPVPAAKISLIVQ